MSVYKYLFQRSLIPAANRAHMSIFHNQASQLFAIIQKDKKLKTALQSKNDLEIPDTRQETSERETK
jgi:hypothetical protein